MTDKNVQLLAHLVRRSGFGATREQLEVMADQGYEATVEKLLDTSNPSRMSDHIIRRYHPEQSGMIGPRASGETWLYRMTTTDTPRSLTARPCRTSSACSNGTLWAASTPCW